MIEAGEYCGFELSFEDPGIALVRFNEPERLNGMTSMFKRDLVEAIQQFQMQAGLTLSNILAQEDAAKLLEEADDYFF